MSMEQRNYNSTAGLGNNNSLETSNMPYSRSLGGATQSDIRKRSSIIDDITSNIEVTLIEPEPIPMRDLRESLQILPDDLSGEEGEGHGHNSGDVKTQIFTSSLNIANTCLGAGILELAYIMKQFGVVLALVIFLGSYLLGLSSCYLLLKAKNLSGHSKYSTIGVFAMGRIGERLIKFMVIVNNVGLCLVYLIIFGDTGNKILLELIPAARGKFYISQKFLIFVVAVVMMPLGFAKTMNRLKSASMVGVSALTLFSIITIYNFFRKLVHNDIADTIDVLPSAEFSAIDALSGLPTVFLAFTFQFNFFPVFKSLDNATDARMRSVSNLSMTLVLSFYIVNALAGYLSYGSAVTSKGLINNFKPEDLGKPLYLILMSAFLVSSTLSFPMMFFGARNNIWAVILSVAKRVKKDWRIRKIRRETNLPNDKIIQNLPKTRVRISWKVYSVYVVILYFLMIAAAIFATEIGKILNIVGAVAANAISYIFPAIFYVKLTKKTQQKWWRISWFMLIFGCISGVICFSSSLYNAISGSDG